MKNEAANGKTSKAAINLNIAPPPTRRKQVCCSTALSLGRKRDKSRQSKTPFLDANAERMETGWPARMPNAFFGPDGTE
jgi:hypothetical protein